MITLTISGRPGAESTALAIAVALHLLVGGAPPGLCVDLDERREAEPSYERRIYSPKT